MPFVVALASGKGGTGKSLLTANLGLLLASLGKRVVVVDAAPGGAGLHGVLGIGELRRALGDGLGEGGPALADLVMTTAVPGLGLVPGEAEGGWRGELDDVAARLLAEQLLGLDADYVLVDLPAGSSRYVVDLFLAAELGVLVLTPDPPAVEQGYRFLRAAFARRLEHMGLGSLIEGDTLPVPLDLYQRYPEIHDELLAMRPGVVLNGVRSKADTEIGGAIATAARRRLGIAPRYLGHVDYDDAVWVSLRRKRSLLVEHPEARASKCIEKVTRRLIAREAEQVVPLLDPTRPDSYYDLLEIEPTSSEEDIRRAHRRVRHLYGRESVVVSGLWPREGVETLQRRFDEAYAALMDPMRRKAYDFELFPDGLPSRHSWRRPETVPPGMRPSPTIASDADLSGRMMKEVREAAGIELREISERTKVATAYLSAIEDEQFDRLPAPVYVRGFLVEYAKMLGLDVTRVLETYFQRFLASRQAGQPG